MAIMLQSYVLEARLHLSPFVGQSNSITALIFRIFLPLNETKGRQSFQRRRQCGSVAPAYEAQLGGGQHIVPSENGEGRIPAGLETGWYATRSKA
jgi:hypothetical protein